MNKIELYVCVQVLCSLCIKLCHRLFVVVCAVIGSLSMHSLYAAVGDQLNTRLGVKVFAPT